VNPHPGSEEVRFFRLVNERVKGLRRIIASASNCKIVRYNVYQGFGLTELSYGGLVSGSRQLLLLAQLPQKYKLHALKEVKK